MTKVSDEELLRRSATGDRAAFEALVARHANALFRFASRACRTQRDAEDALQEGLLAAWRGSASFRGDAAARTWLFQVVVHACRRHRRKRAGEPELMEQLDAVRSAMDGAPRPDGTLATRQLGAALDLALAAMPAEAREVLVLRDVEGMQGREVAEALGINVAAMKSRLHRARLELKQRVESVLGHPIKR